MRSLTRRRFVRPWLGVVLFSSQDRPFPSQRALFQAKLESARHIQLAERWPGGHRTQSRRLDDEIEAGV